MRIRDCSSDVCSSDLFVALETSLHEMRLKKSAAGLKLMARACALSAEAHCIAMRQTKAGVNEWQIGAEIASHFARNGDRKSTRLNSRHSCASRMPTSAGTTRNNRNTLNPYHIPSHLITLSSIM